jgi:hypothetical protein
MAMTLDILPIIIQILHPIIQATSILCLLFRCYSRNSTLEWAKVDVKSSRRSSYAELLDSTTLRSRHATF